MGENTLFAKILYGFGQKFEIFFFPFFRPNTSKRVVHDFPDRKLDRIKKVAKFAF